MATSAKIRAIDYHIPEAYISNEQLASEIPNWSAEKVNKKTGISRRYIAEHDECSSDLGVLAVESLFANGSCHPDNIDFILFCTQTPDYFLPTTACIIQDRLGINTRAGAMDFNLGCSGYIYGLGIAKGLIETGQSDGVLLITSETYSKLIHPQDGGVRSLFSDGAAATFISSAAQKTDKPSIGPFVYGTDGSGAKNLIVSDGAFRNRTGAATMSHPIEGQFLTMNGSEIFKFSLEVVPGIVDAILSQSSLKMDDIDLFVFHQANKFMLDHLRKKIQIPEEKFFVNYQKVGNLVSASIPVALKDAIDQNILQKGMTCVAVGFGVGYSWGATVIRL